MRIQWRFVLCFNGCRWRIEEILDEQGWRQIRHRVLRRTVPTGFEVHQRRGKSRSVPRIGFQLLRMLQGNVEGWQPSSNDANAGVGGHGSCCAEMDIWEANAVSTAVTPHSCSTIEQSRCDGDGCGGTYSADRYAGVCDPDGCDFNSYRMGVKDFYGKGKTVDTSKKFTVVTQFVGTGDAMEIKRFYVQNGKTIAQPASTVPGVDGNSITTKFCDEQKAAFHDTYTFKDKGGMANMAKALANGMVLVMSLWDDHYSNMLWLDSTYPTDKNPDTDLGTGRGECETTSGVPADIESQHADATVVYSNIKFGPLNSTFG